MAMGGTSNGSRELGEKRLDAANAVGRVRDAAAASLRQHQDGGENQMQPAAFPGNELLTPREREVLRLISRGMLNKQIAHELGSAVKTIKIHRGRIMDKMRVRSATVHVGLLSRMDFSHGH